MAMHEGESALQGGHYFELPTRVHALRFLFRYQDNVYSGMSSSVGDLSADVIGVVEFLRNIGRYLQCA